MLDRYRYRGLKKIKINKEVHHTSCCKGTNVINGVLYSCTTLRKKRGQTCAIGINR